MSWIAGHDFRRTTYRYWIYPGHKRYKDMELAQEKMHEWIDLRRIPCYNHGFKIYFATEEIRLLALLSAG